MSDNDLKTICSITELVKNLDLSRSRFYQLLKSGVFPEPVYTTLTKRPFYPPDLQEKCIEIRRTGIGFNGQPIVFNTKRKANRDKSQSQRQNKCKELTDILRGMGLTATCSDVEDALKVLYPNGPAKCVTDDMIIRELFRYFRRGCEKNVLFQ